MGLPSPKLDAAAMIPHRLPNERHEVFSFWYSLGHSKTACAIRAKYSKTCAPSVGCNLAKRDDIKARVRYLQTTGGTIYDPTGKTWVVNQLAHIVTESMRDDETRDFSNANRALEALARIGGLFAPTETRSVKVTMNGKELDAHIKERLRELSPEDRTALAAADDSLKDILEAEAVPVE